MSIVTLTTDLGTTDAYVAQIKALIVQRAPGTVLIDVTHDIKKFDRLHASHVVKQLLSSLPAGTVHLIGVDTLPSPDRGFVAATWAEQHFVAPDNGILSFMFDDRPERSSDLTAIIRHVGITLFPERDILAEAAAHLAKGGAIEMLGAPLPDIHRQPGYRVAITGHSGLTGQVIHIDTYGNFITNITKKQFDDVGRGRPFEIIVRNREHTIKQISKLYEDSNADPFDRGGQLLALFGSSGQLELAMRWGSAATMLHLTITDNIRVEFK